MLKVQQLSSLQMTAMQPFYQMRPCFPNWKPNKGKNSMQGAVTKIIRILQVLFFTENRKENNEMGMSRYIQKTCLFIISLSSTINPANMQIRLVHESQYRIINKRMNKYIIWINLFPYGSLFFLQNYNTTNNWRHTGLINPEYYSGQCTRNAS